MALTHWLPIPTYTARHKSKFRKKEPYRIENIGEYLVNPIGWKIYAENADPEDPHLTDVKIDGGHLTFHTATISNEITENIRLIAEKYGEKNETIMKVNIWEF